METPDESAEKEAVTEDMSQRIFGKMKNSYYTGLKNVFSKGQFFRLKRQVRTQRNFAGNFLAVSDPSGGWFITECPVFDHCADYFDRIDIGTDGRIIVI